MAWEEYYADWYDDYDYCEEYFVNNETIHRNATVVTSTEKALLINVPNVGDCWVPKSMCTIYPYINGIGINNKVALKVIDKIKCEDLGGDEIII